MARIYKFDCGEKMKLSVIIPTYNRKNLLELALKSVLEQDYKNLEIIITDDYSTDGTKELADEYMKKHGNIFYFLNEKYEKGPNGNKNNGFDKATGEALVILDDDDILLPNTLSKMVKILKQGYHSVWAQCYYEIDGKLTDKFSGFGINKSGEIDKKDYYNGKIQGEFLVMFRREMLGDKRFESGLYGNENTLWIDFFDYRAYYLHEAVRIYRIKQDDSVMSNAFKHSDKIIKGYEIYIQKLFQKSDNIDKKYLSKLYFILALHHKSNGNLAKMYKNLFQSLSLNFDKKSFVLLFLGLLPRQVFVFLINKIMSAK